MTLRSLILFCLLAPAGAVGEVSDGERIVFEVLDAATGQKLYEGDEFIKVKGGTVSKRTVYRALDRREVMVERVSYDLKSLRVDEFVSEHPVSGEVMNLVRRGDRLDISYVPRRGESAQRSDQLTWNPDTRMGKTLHHIILRNWDTLLQGQPVGFKLLVPSKFDSYDFRIALQPASGPDHVFRLEPVSWLVRQFVDAMDFHYSVDRIATRYVGPTTVGYYDQPERKVEIRFSY
jgi:hypothetical protein